MVLVCAAGVGFTVWLTAADALPAKFASPPYVAVSDLAPALVGTRLQLVAGSVIVQLLVPSLTVIVPVGVPPPGAVTATPALTAIGALTFDGSGVWLVIAAVVAALLIVTLPLPPPLLALAAKVALPA